MQSNPSAREPKDRDPRWMQVMLIAIACGMALLLWFAEKNKSQNPNPVLKARLVPAPAPPRIRMLAPRTLPPFRRPKAAPRKAPTPRQPRVKYDPAKFFSPIPFAIPDRAAFYAKGYAEGAKLEIGIHEKQFLERLTKERMYEAKNKSYRLAVMRITAIRYLRYRGYVRFQKLGFKQLQQFELALQKYLAQGGPVDRIPGHKSPLASLVAQLTPHGGYYPLLLRNAGVKAGTRSLNKTQLFWLRTLFLSRWALAALGHYPLAILMGKTVYADYLRARILYARDSNKRVWAVRELKRYDKSIPHLRVLGWLMIQVRRRALAIRSLQDAIKRDPKDQQSRALLKKLLKTPS